MSSNQSVDSVASRLGLSPLVDVYHTVCDVDAPSFLPCIDEPSVVNLMFGHGLVSGTMCHNYSQFCACILEHLVTGLCASRNGSMCDMFVRSCTAAGVYPSVFVMSCVVSSTVVDQVHSDDSAIYVDCFAPFAV